MLARLSSTIQITRVSLYHGEMEWKASLSEVGQEDILGMQHPEHQDGGGVDAKDGSRNGDGRYWV